MGVAVLFRAMFQRQRMDLQGKWAFKLDVRGNGEESGFATAPFAEECDASGNDRYEPERIPARKDGRNHLSHTVARLCG